MKFVIFRALVQTMEKSKKKYQSRLKKMEQQMMGMMENHASQVSSKLFTVPLKKYINEHKIV